MVLAVMSTTLPSRESHCTLGVEDGQTCNNTLCDAQRRAADSAWSKIDEAIMEKLDYAAFPPSAKKMIMIADLGCSVGPNTFYAVQNIIHSWQRRHLSQGLSSSGLPQFQVFFSDHVNNDFNTLFVSLPPDRYCFAAGVPRSFHNRLFPDSSLHFVHCTFALRWLSKLPKELINPNTPFFNKGRVHYTGAPAEVRKAYEARFAVDMAAFLSARSKEMLGGGLMEVTMPGIAAGVPHSRVTSGMMYEIVGHCLMDMVEEEIIGEAELDSFNLPVYSPTPEMAHLINKDGGIQHRDAGTDRTRTETERSNTVAGPDPASEGRNGVVTKHFGKEIIDQLFDRFFRKTEEQTDRISSLTPVSSQILFILKRKQH